METKKPKVILFNHTALPLHTLSLPVSAWTSDNFPESLDEITTDDAKVNTRKALSAFHKTALEYIDLIFIIKNCSRAFQQQLTRTRLASFSIQSMRVVTKEGFATNGNYTMPPGLDDHQKKTFHNTMVGIENAYNRLLADDVRVEDARGILPLNIHSDISMKINLASLYNMTRQRLCVNTQWEYRQVVRQMKHLIKEKLGYIFSQHIDAPCVKALKCPMRNEYCGVPVWQYDEGTRMDIYRDFAHWWKDDKDWVIKWETDSPIGEK